MLSKEICDPPIHSDTLDVRISHGDVMPVVFRQFGECGSQYRCD